MILAGDIGGTHTRLAFLQERGGSLTAVAEETFPSREHASLEAVLQKFITAHSFPITCACFGIAYDLSVAFRCPFVAHVRKQYDAALPFSCNVEYGF